MSNLSHLNYKLQIAHKSSAFFPRFLPTAQAADEAEGQGKSRGWMQKQGKNALLLCAICNL